MEALALVPELIMRIKVLLLIIINIMANIILTLLLILEKKKRITSAKKKMMKKPITNDDDITNTNSMSNINKLIESGGPYKVKSMSLIRPSNLPRI